MPAFLNGGGEMGALTRAFDWSKTSLGTPHTWPQSLRTTLSIILASRFPMFLFWGPELLCFYNDAYRPSLGNDGKHPSSLGRPGAEVWPEIWKDIKPLIDGVLAGGEATWSEDQLLPVYRNGRLEDVYWTFSYSPVTDESGKPAGVFVSCTETTDSVVTVNKLRLSEQRFRNLMRDADIGIIILKGEELIVEVVNEAYARLIGRTADEITGKPLFSIIPEAKDPFEAILLDILHTGNLLRLYNQPYSVNVEGAIKEGILNIVYQPYREAGGEITGVTALCVDVTHQHETAIKLEKSEQRFQGAIAAVEGILWTNSAEGKMEGLQPGWALLTGQSPEEYAGYGWASAVHRDDAQPTIDAWNVAVAARTTFTFEHRVRTQDGTYRHFSVRAIPMTGADGEIQEWVGVHTDITGQRLALQKLEEAEASLRGAIELAELGTWEIDLATRILEYSARARVWFGLDAEEIITVERAYEVVREEDRPIIREAILKAIAPGSDGIYDIEYAVDTTDGHDRILHAQGKAFYNKKGEAYKIAGTVRDVTAIRHRQQELERQVQERTEELASAIEELRTTNEELEDTNTRLHHSNEELAQYAYVASHDLQEPLRKIRMFTDILSTKIVQTAPDKVELVQKISASAARMTTLIRDLLDFSRLLKSETLMRPIDLAEVSTAVVSDFELTISEKAATVHISNLPVIEAIGLQMNQLFYNLLSNALKFSQPGVPPVITISSELIAPDAVAAYIPNPLPFAQYHHIAVADNGIGFEVKYAEQIFDVFKRLHTRDTYPGSGIGLALCRRIVSNHNGHLYAESTPGQGTIFHLLLPDKQQQHESGLPDGYQWTND